MSARPAAWVLFVTALALSGCCCRPRTTEPPPLTREHRLEELGLFITLPGDWRGGRIGEAFIFTSGPADCSLSFDDGLAGIPMSEAGARTFLEERADALVEATGPRAFGGWRGVEGIGTSRQAPDTRIHFGYFAGPRMPVWTHLDTRGLSRVDADALWQSITLGVR